MLLETSLRFLKKLQKDCQWLFVNISFADSLRFVFKNQKQNVYEPLAKFSLRYLFIDCLRFASISQKNLLRLRIVLRRHVVSKPRIARDSPFKYSCSFTKKNNIMITMFIVKLTHMSHLSCPVKPDRYVDVVTAVSILFTPSFMLLPPMEIKRLF